MNNTILKYAGLNAAGTALYIALVSTFLFNASTIFGKDREDTVLAPIAMLLLFVLSASTTGLFIGFGTAYFLVFGGQEKRIGFIAHRDARSVVSYYSACIHRCRVVVKVKFEFFQAAG